MSEGSRLSGRQRRRLIKGLGLTALLLLPVGIFVLALSLAGVIAAIVYTLLFVVGATAVPVFVLLLRDAMPDLVGTLLVALGSLAAGEAWLVQHDGEWRIHPGRTLDGESQVWLANEWRPVADTTHQTRLAWQPFGLLWSKESVAGTRADAPAETVTDGGQSSTAGGWTVGMHQWLSAGLMRIGDIAMLSEIEEVTARKASESGGSTARGALIGSIVGLILGIMTGYAAVFL
jgi:hypothetical protein